MNPAPSTRIVVLGGGVGGLAAARHLERLFRDQPATEIVLVSRDNFFLLSPLLFEACSGVLDVRHCVQPIRPCLRRARFIKATVQGVDVAQRVVRLVVAERGVVELPYDHLVVTLGATTNMALIPGSDHAHTFKTVADALLLRNHLIERFERAEVETDPRLKRQLLAVVVIGGGLVGVELIGELTAFADDILRYYPRIRREELHFHLFEVGERLLPESSSHLATYATRILRARGAELHTSTAVQAIEPGAVRWKGGVVETDTVVLVAGIVPNIGASAIPVECDRRGRIVTDATMRSTSHPQVWALGDCAAIPAPDGQPYPALAQHALREARLVARNIHAVTAAQAPAPFIYRTIGIMAAFGRMSAAADVRGFNITGFPAWWIRRSYYLFQMPRWDTRLRIVFDWTVALFFRAEPTQLALTAEREQPSLNSPVGRKLRETSQQRDLWQDEERENPG